MMRKAIILVVITLLFGNSYAIDKTVSDTAQVEQTEDNFPPDDWRGYRFCEVLIVTRTGMTANIYIYNTVGLGNCPEGTWANLDADTLAQENDALAVVLNGPRYWMVNEVVGIGENAAENTTLFGNLEMRQVAELSMPIRQLRDIQNPYTESEGPRATSFIYREGNRVYELVAPDGSVYRMQIYSQTVGESMSVEELETLGSRLDLPTGWRFESRVLTETEELAPDDAAITIQDDLQNVYQKVN